MNSEALLSKDELEKLLVALGKTRGDRGFTEADAKIVQEWAVAARVAHNLLELALDGAISIDVEAGQVTFKNG